MWLGIFGFVGNYWFTHYFYCVLKAQYTMPSWDLNGVPIPMYFATHFYFCFYHVLSSCLLRKALTTFEPSRARSIFLVALVCTMSFTTAFLESATISAFPCYLFEDTHMAYTRGSAFYSIYFIVSFPMFLRLDEHQTTGCKRIGRGARCTWRFDGRAVHARLRARRSRGDRPDHHAAQAVQERRCAHMLGHQPPVLTTSWGCARQTCL